jgi:hypothetical protein
MVIGKMMKDKCVTCGVESIYDKEEHIDFRVGYIEGSGQLCLDCYDKIYIKSKKNEKVKNENESME